MTCWSKLWLCGLTLLACAERNDATPSDAGGGLGGASGAPASGASSGQIGSSGAAGGTAGSTSNGGSTGGDAGGDAAGAGGLTQDEIDEILAMPRQPFRFHHAHINSVDPEASVEFYEQHFDAAAVTLADGVTAVRSGDHLLLFDPVQVPAPAELVSGIFHVGFGVDDLEQAYDDLLALGVESETPPYNTGQRRCTGGGTTPNVAFMYGPDHEVFELNPASAPDFRHVHFLSSDPIASGRWYVEHLGLSSSTPNPSNQVTYCQDVQVNPIFGANLDGITVYWYPLEFSQGYYPEAWEGRAELEPQPGRVIDHIALSVDDLDRAVDRLWAEGVSILSRPQAIFDGQLRSAFIAGPDGVDVEIVEGHVGQ